MLRYPQTVKVRYGLAFGFTAAALLLRLALDPYLGKEFPFITFYMAITAIAYFAGPGPSLLTIFLSLVSAASLFMGISLYPSRTIPLVGSISFLCVTMLITGIGYIARRSQALAEANALEAERRRKQAEREIAERRKAEQTLRQTYERLAQAEKVALVMPLHVSLEGCWQKVTPNFCRFLGYEEEELLGRHFRDFTHPADFDAEWNQVLRLKSSEIQSFQMEKRFIRKDGKVVWGYLNCAIVTDEQGKPLYFLTYVLDINEKKVVGEKLSYKVATLNLAVESADIGTFDFYPETGVLRWSETTRRHFGLPRNAPVDYEVFLSGIHEEDRAKVDQLIRQSLEQETSISTEFRTLGLQDGKERWIAVRGRVFYDHRGGPLRLIGTTLDMSDRRRAEEDLRKTMNDWSRSNLELAQFAYVASHDLQEPLRMIASYLQLLENKYRGNIDEKADSYIHYAVDGAKRMQRLIEGLLAYSQITRGAAFSPVNTGKVFSEALANLDASIKESDAAVNGEGLPTVMGDEIQLLQLFQNLIGNAIKYRKRDIPLVVTVSAQKQHGEWLFVVKDNGIGIEAEHYQKIFQIFQRLHSRDEYSGTGIGLALCKRIVERHGGRIWVESAFGQGTTFLFTIPVMKGVLHK